MLVSGSGWIAVAQAASAGELLQPGVDHSAPESMLEALMEVADLPEFVLDPARFHSLLKITERGGREIIFLQRLERGFGGQHAALDGQMNALQPLRIQEAGGVAEDHPAIAGHRRNRPPAAVGQRLRAVANHLAAFEQLGHKRMPLELLQHALRIETRVGIVEPGDEAERDHIVLAAVNPGAAVFLRGQRPAHGVNHFAGSDAAGGNFPQFLYALAVGLRVAISVEIETLR